MSSFLRDLRIGCRTLIRTPGFTIVALGTLAIGIGATAMICSFVTAVFAASSPPRDLDRLVSLWSAHPSQGTGRTVVSPRDFLEWRQRAGSFERLAAWRRAAFNLSGIDRPVRVGGQEVSSEYFSIVDHTVSLGRPFAASDERPGAPDVAVLSDRFWRERFAASPDVLGRTIALDGRPVTITGVLAPRPLSPEILVPLRIDPAATDNARSLFVFARLRDGVSLEQARDELMAIGKALEQEAPETNRGWGVAVRPLAQEYIGPNARLVFALLMAAVTAILLIGCANIANLMGARGLARQRNLAIRSALGAGRAVLFRHALAESAVLALAGGVAGAALAHVGLAWIRASNPLFSEVARDVRVGTWTLLFATAASAISTLAFGLVPALQGARVNLERTLREGTARSIGGRRAGRTRWVLVIGEVAASMALLVVAGLLMRTLTAFQSVEPGFDPRGLLTARVTLPEATYRSPAAVTTFFEQVVDRVAQDAQVVSASAGSRVPVAGSRFNPNRSLVIEGRSVRADEGAFAHDLAVMPGYFAVLGIPLVQGRDFWRRDAAAGPLVAIVNQTMARRYWGDGSPVGGRLRLGDEPSPDVWRTIVGVAGDVRNDDIDSPPVPHVYVPHAQRPARTMTLVVRSRADPAALGPALRAAAAGIDPALPLYEMATMEQIVRQDLGDTRVLVGALATFALCALLLAVVGIGGVLAQMVVHRTPEIGVRVALGASRWDIVSLVSRQALLAVGAGLLVGLALAVMLGRLVAGVLYQVSPVDPATYAMVVVVLLASALAAVLVPTLRAVRVDPIIALRAE